MALHHKLCHVLGGAFDLPHAETHAVLLPHTVAYNAPAAPDAMDRVARALGAADVPARLFDLATRRRSVPSSLRTLGLPGDSARSRDRRWRSLNPYWNPRPLERDGIRALLTMRGREPAADDEARHDHARLQRSSRISRAVLERMANCRDDRLREDHDVARRPICTRSSRKSNRRSRSGRSRIDFLTRTGQICDDKRQEFILLSDTLGVSMLVDAINHRRNVGATESTVLGPFHVAGAPRLQMGDSISRDGKGEPLYMSGRVSNESGAPIAGAVLDVWQTSFDGFYDVQDDRQPR